MMYIEKSVQVEINNEGKSTSAASTWKQKRLISLSISAPHTPSPTINTRVDSPKVAAPCHLRRGRCVGRHLLRSDSVMPLGVLGIAKPPVPVGMAIPLVLVDVGMMPLPAELW